VITSHAIPSYSCILPLSLGGLDLIITPGLGFTKSGQRLGSGRGYYDRYFEKILHQPLPEKEQRHHYSQQKQNRKEALIQGEHDLMSCNKTYLIGLAFKQQILPFIETNSQDVTMDQVIHSGDD